MALPDDLPVSATLGIFVGVSGFDWLTKGHAEPLEAVAIALLGGALILALRAVRKRVRKD